MAEGAQPVGIELDLRIGIYEADLVPISWMGVTPDGTIAVGQVQDRSIRFRRRCHLCQNATS